MAAVLVAGVGAVLSHGTAAAAWDLRPPGGAIHVTVPGNGGRKRRAGLRIHRSTTLDDIATVRGIPVTSPLRTILDLATILADRPLEHVVDLADQRHLIDFAELRRRRLPRSLQAVLTLYAQAVTRSELEERFLALCDDHRLPRPLTNAIIEGREVDFVWREARLIVEVDGYRYHRAPSTFEDDRERDVTLSVAGWAVLRFSYAQVVRRPAWVAAAVATHLAPSRRRPRRQGAM
jgi:very-short-patch-repair endonuclease